MWRPFVYTPVVRPAKPLPGGNHADIERIVFLLTVALAGATFWIAPRPPMVDMPQHAGQVALWRDLIAGHSKWQPLVYINYFTPYLLGYSIALLLSFVVPIIAAFKLALTLALFAFVAVCVVLRRHLGGNRYLDWLFIPGFFGFAYSWGFYTFLVATPFGAAFILLALRYAQRPTMPSGTLLVLVGLGLFFSHGLIFLFVNAVGVTFILIEAHPRSPARILRAATPYAALALCCLAYAVIRLPVESNSASNFSEVTWGPALERLKFFFVFPLGAPAADPLLAPLRMLLLATPFLLGVRLNRVRPSAFIPLFIVLAVFAFVPVGAANTWFLYQRFDVFILPFYALLFRGTDATAIAMPWQRAARLWPVLLCWLFMAIHIGRLVDYSKESAAFDDVLAATQPDGRALGLIFDPASAATRNPFTYFNYPVWYQAEKKGFVDFNAARFVPQIVRYRPGLEPVDSTEAGWNAKGFDWGRTHAEIYRYFFVRSSHALPEGYFPEDVCKPSLLRAAGDWKVFENVNCHVP